MFNRKVKAPDIISDAGSMMIFTMVIGLAIQSGYTPEQVADWMNPDRPKMEFMEKISEIFKEKLG